MACYDQMRSSHSCRFVSTLHEGFTVNYRQLGLVFELGQNEDKEDASGDRVIHRIGRATSERLLRATPEDLTPPISWDRLRATLRGNGLARARSIPKSHLAAPSRFRRTRQRSVRLLRSP